MNQRSRVPEPTGRLTGRARAVILLVAATIFMELLDGTVIVTAIPQMAGSFRVGAVDLNVGITAYLVALAASLPLSGWIADRFDAHLIFPGGIALFTAASALCGLSSTMSGFAAARVLQGVAAAAMNPVGQLVVLRLVGKDQLMRAMGAIVWPAMVAPVLGPPLGGLIVGSLSWRWIFFVNVPLGLTAVGLAFWLVPHGGERWQRPFDAVGFLLSGVAITLFICGVDRLGAAGEGLSASIILVISLALSGLAARWFGRSAHPLLNLAPLRIKTFAAAIYGGSAFRAAFGATPFLLPLMFQTCFGMNPLRSGLLVLCVFAGNLAMKAGVNRIIRRFGFRDVLVVNGILVALSLSAVALLTPSTSFIVVGAILFFAGVFRSLQFTGYTTLQMADVAPSDLTSANTLSFMAIHLMTGVGVTLGALALKVSALMRGRASGPPDLVDFHNAFLAAGVLSLIGIADMMMLRKDSGRLIYAPVRPELSGE